jgi:rod shape-determining protein MreD
MDLSPASRTAMTLPAPLSLLAGSIAIALLLNLLPWSGWALRAHPDFLLVVMLYWAAHEPRRIGQGWGFLFGLMMDVADSVLLGQHAMAYVAALFCVQLLRVRVLQLTIFEQALHIGAILLVAQGIGILLNLSLGRDFPGLAMLLAPLFGAILWPAVNYLATLPRFRNRSRRRFGGEIR